MQFIYRIGKEISSVATHLLQGNICSSVAIIVVYFLTFIRYWLIDMFVVLYSDRRGKDFYEYFDGGIFVSLGEIMNVVSFTMFTYCCIYLHSDIIYIVKHAMFLIYSFICDYAPFEEGRAYSFPAVCLSVGRSLGRSDGRSVNQQFLFFFCRGWTYWNEI